MINVLICGANGRMGKKVYDAVSLSNNLKAVCGVDLVENLSTDYPVYSSFEKVTEKVDVVIDFSSPKSLPAILDFCKR